MSLCVTFRRFAPISADWLGNHRPAKDSLFADGAVLYYEEQLLLCNVMLSHAVLDIETERVRQLERGADLSHIDLEHEHEELLLAEQGALTVESESRAERSLLYASVSARLSGSTSPKRDSPSETLGWSRDHR